MDFFLIKEYVNMLWAHSGLMDIDLMAQDWGTEKLMQREEKKRKRKEREGSERKETRIDKEKRQRR